MAYFQMVTLMQQVVVVYDDRASFGRHYEMVDRCASSLARSYSILGMELMLYGVALHRVVHHYDFYYSMIRRDQAVAFAPAHSLML